MNGLSPREDVYNYPAGPVSGGQNAIVNPRWMPSLVYSDGSASYGIGFCDIYLESSRVFYLNEITITAWNSIQVNLEGGVESSRMHRIRIKADLLTVGAGGVPLTWLVTAILYRDFLGFPDNVTTTETLVVSHEVLDTISVVFDHGTETFDADFKIDLIRMGILMGTPEVALPYGA